MPSSNKRPISVTPCGTRRGGENFGSGCAGSGAQSLRASRHLHKSRPQRQRRMSGEVGDRQHLVAQRRHQQQIDFATTRAPSPPRPCAAAGPPARNPPRREIAPGGRDSATRRAPAPSAVFIPPLERQFFECRRRLRRKESAAANRTASREAKPRPASCPASSTVSSAARSTSVAGLSFIHFGK